MKVVWSLSHATSYYSSPRVSYLRPIIISQCIKTCKSLPTENMYVAMPRGAFGSRRFGIVVSLRQTRTVETVGAGKPRDRLRGLI